MGFTPTGYQSLCSSGLSSTMKSVTLIAANSVRPCWPSIISYPTHARGTIFFVDEIVTEILYGKYCTFEEILRTKALLPLAIVTKLIGKLFWIYPALRKIE